MLLLGSARAYIADVAQHLEARGLPFVHAEALYGPRHVRGIELDGGIALADATHPVAQDGFRPVAVVVGADVEDDR